MSLLSIVAISTAGLIAASAAAAPASPNPVHALAVASVPIGMSGPAQIDNVANDSVMLARGAGFRAITLDASAALAPDNPGVVTIV